MNQMNLWTRYKVKCPNENGFTFGQLNMKRKAVTLQHRQNAFTISKKEKFNLIVQGRYYNNKTPASDPSCVRGASYEDSSPASTNDVPGDKSFMIKNDRNVPIYNYIPVKRTYKGGANKYPYTAWSYGKTGFPIGSKGSSAESRAAAARELSNNAPLYSKLALTSCDYIPCRGKDLEVKGRKAYKQCYIYINTTTYPLDMPEKLKWLDIPDYSPLYNVGGAWASTDTTQNIIHLVTIHNNIFTYYFIYQPDTTTLTTLGDIITKPFMVLQNKENVAANTTFSYIFDSDVRTDCSNIFFNYNVDDSGIPFAKDTLNKPHWIHQFPYNTLCEKDIECYWWSGNNILKPYPPDISLNFGNPHKNNKDNLEAITTRKQYEITITCGN